VHGPREGAEPATVICAERGRYPGNADHTAIEVPLDEAKAAHPSERRADPCRVHAKALRPIDTIDLTAAGPRIEELAAPYGKGWARGGGRADLFGTHLSGVCSSVLAPPVCSEGSAVPTGSP
jgi:hypothetical protein